MLSFLDTLQDKVKENILDAQLSQRQSYAKRHPLADNTFNVGDKVLVKNLRRDDRKGGWISMPWLGPFTIHDIIKNKICVLKTNQKILKTKVLVRNIKKYYESDDPKCNTDVGDDIFISSITQQNSENRVFYPVGKIWQQSKCRSLKLNLTNINTNFIKSKVLTFPSEIKNIVGDGNCLYRALSYWITGGEDDHLYIRKVVCKVIIQKKMVNNCNIIYTN